MSVLQFVSHGFGRSARLIFTGVILCSLTLTTAVRAGPSLAIDASTGQVIIADNAGQPWYPASLTKLMTAYLTFSALKAGKLKLSDRIPVTRAAHRVVPSKIGLKTGTMISVDFALRALLVYSANDMALVLAHAVGGNVPDFVQRMNATARKLGMSATHYANPHGLYDPRQVTTARDIAILALAIQNTFPQYRHYFSEPYVRVGRKHLRNRNLLLRQMPDATGMKTGYICDAGFNLVGSATINHHRYIAVVFGAKSAKARADIAQMLLETAAHRRGTYKNAELVTQIRDHAGSKPGNMRDIVCKGSDRVDWARPSQLEGWGASFGRLDSARKADTLLAGRLASTSNIISGGDAGVVRVPGTKEYVALVWSLKEAETLSLCAFLRSANAHCEVIPPAAFAEFARQASADRPKSRTQRHRGSRASR